AGLNRDGIREHRSRVGAGMEFSTLGALVDSFRQIGEKLRVEFSACKGSVEVFRVQTRDSRPEAVRDHRLCERRRVRAKEWKDRRQAAPGQPFFPIASDVLEKQVAECHVSKPLSYGSRDRGRHRLFVDCVWTWRRNRHSPERQSETTSLRFKD